MVVSYVDNDAAIVPSVDRRHETSTQQSTRRRVPILTEAKSTLPVTVEVADGVDLCGQRLWRFIGAVSIGKIELIGNAAVGAEVFLRDEVFTAVC
jgi:hypothetical protein